MFPLLFSKYLDGSAWDTIYLHGLLEKMHGTFLDLGIAELGKLIAKSCKKCFGSKHGHTYIKILIIYFLSFLDTSLRNK